MRAWGCALLGHTVDSEGKMNVQQCHAGTVCSSALCVTMLREGVDLWTFAKKNCHALNRASMILVKLGRDLTRVHLGPQNGSE